jgi:7-cyano-7-deazaguanine tRNA-ribosyltransferase
LEEMRYLPCSCPICQDYTASELQESPQRTKLLAMHNLYVSFEEMRLVKQHIWEGSLWDLLEARCRAHPRMLDALRSLFCHVSWMERLDKSSKSTFYYLGRASAARPEVLAYRRRLKRLELVSSVLLTDTPEEWEGFDQVLGWKPPFGAYPLELGETYPLNAEVPEIVDEEAILEGIRNTQIVMAANPQARFHLQFRDPKIKEALEATASFARDGND